MKEKQLTVGALLSYVSLAFHIISGLLYTPWMVETVGESQYGLYTLANSLITLFLVDFGLSTAVSRFVSRYRAEGDEASVNRILGAIYRVYLVLTGILFLVLATVFLLLGRIYGQLTPSELSDFKIVYLIAAAFALLNFPAVTLNGILNSYERFIELKAADLVYRVLLLACSIAALLLGYGIFGLVTVHALVGVLLIVYKLIVIRRNTPVCPDFHARRPGLYKAIFTFSIWVTVVSLSQRLIFTISPSILGIVAGTSAIAVFGVVTAIEGYAYSITGAINGMFIPKVSRLYAEGTAKDRLFPLLLRVGKFQFAINGLIVVGFAVVGRAFVSLWMGPAYADAYIGLLLVLIPGLFGNSLEIASTALLVENKMRYMAFVMTTVGVLNVVLSFIFSSRYGAIGACLSIGVAYSVRAVLMHIVYQRKLGLCMRSFIARCYVPMSAPVLLTLGGGWILNRLFTFPGWWEVLVKGGAVVLLYALLVFFFGISREEKKLLRECLHR